jgi:hypothetical protein
MALVFTRCALVAIALLSGAWFVISFRAVELESDAKEVLSRARNGSIGVGQVRHAQALLSRARWLNADMSPLVNESVLLLEVGRRTDAAAIAERVVAEEPSNLDGWGLLYLVSGNQRSAGQALRRVRALNPLAADALVHRPPVFGP